MNQVLDNLIQALFPTQDWATSSFEVSPILSCSMNLGYTRTSRSFSAKLPPSWNFSCPAAGNFASVLVKLHHAPVKSFLQPAEAPLDSPLVYQPMHCLPPDCQLPLFLNYSELWCHEQPIRSLGTSTVEHSAKIPRALNQVYQGTAKLSSFV